MGPAVICPKIPYASRREAQLASRNTAGGSKVYRCGVCGNWHLSRKSARQVKRTRKGLDAPGRWTTKPWTVTLSDETRRTVYAVSAEEAMNLMRSHLARMGYDAVPIDAFEWESVPRPVDP